MSAAALAAALLLVVTPVAVGDEPRDTVDQTADSLDEETTAARCEAWSQVWPGSSDDCPLDAEPEYRCALWGQTTSADPGSDGLGYVLAGEIECRQDGRVFRTLHGTFSTGAGLITRTCQSPWCDRRGVPYDVYATTSYRPRCVYHFTGPEGTNPTGGTLWERSSAPPDPDHPRLALDVDLPGEQARFRADDFTVANGDGVGARGGTPQPGAGFWVLDDGDPTNGWAEGAADLRITIHEHAEGLAGGDPFANCLPTDELSGFSVEGTLDFVIGEESLFRPPGS